MINYDSFEISENQILCLFQNNSVQSASMKWLFFECHELTTNIFNLVFSFFDCFQKKTFYSCLVNFYFVFANVQCDGGVIIWYHQHLWNSLDFLFWYKTQCRQSTNFSSSLWQNIQDFWLRVLHCSEVLKRFLVLLNRVVRFLQFHYLLIGH